MRIGIDARWIIEEPSGIGQYTLNLIRHLARKDSKNEYFLFFQNEKIAKRIKEELRSYSERTLHFILVSYGVFSIKNQIFLPWKLRSLRIDVFHSTNFMIPLFGFGTKYGVTIHDLIPFLFPEFAPRSKKSRFYRIYQCLMKRIVKKAAFILVDSNHSAKDLTENFSKARDKTFVMTFGIDPSFQSSMENSSSAGIREKLGIHNQIILYVGRQDPYKNLMSLIRIHKNVLEKGTDATLVIAGSRDDRYPEITSLIAELQLQGKVKITGYLSQRDLVSLYREASLLALPSLYEGFGLPVLEAMASGIPVIASNKASIPEVMGDAGILLNPDSHPQWVDAIIQLLTNSEIRQNFIEKGRQRLSLFSWEKAAERAVSIYERYK